MANENEPAAPLPPSSVASAAKPLSAAELSAELTPKSPPVPQMKPPVIPEAKKRGPSPDRPDYKQALKDRVMNKQDEEQPPAKPEPKKEAPKVEKKPVVSSDDAPPPVKAEATPETVPDEHKRVLPHDKPDTARRIKAILAERDAAKAEAAAAKAEYEAAKKAPSTPPEELTKLRQEYEATQADLMRYRRLHDIENDKEFAAKYREPVKQVEAAVEGSLKKNGFSEPVLDVIRKEGGFAEFSRSNKTFQVNEADPDNEGQTRPVYRTAAELARNWLNALPAADAELIRASIGKQQLLREEEKNAIAQAQSEAKTYFEGQTAAQRAASEAAQQQQQATMKEYQEWLKSTEEKTEWLKDRPLPENATPEQKAEVDNYNEFTRQMRDRLKKDPTNAKEYGELKLEAAESHHLRRTLGEYEAKVAALEAQLAKSKNALRTTSKGGSILKSDAAPKDKKGIDQNDPTNYRLGLRARVLAGRDEE
jgi:hypothetical protein